MSFSVLVNGEPHEHFTSNKGGYPISPYLFLLCAGGLHPLIQQVEVARLIQGVYLCRADPKVSHLFFADDSLLFCLANQFDCNTIKELLQLYEAASGQQINQDKTQLFFSTNTDHETQEHIKGVLGVSATSTHYESYLGLPSFVGRSKRQSFSFIQEQIWHKIQDWKEKLLFQSGREVLVKAILQAMPTSSMGCFLLPKCLCKDTESLIRKVRWGYKGDSWKNHWVGWKKLCLLKCQGGLGFKDIENSTKHCWENRYGGLFTTRIRYFTRYSN